MTPFRLDEEWEEAAFVRRPNRFVMKLMKEDGPIRAYLPNPGRMEEFLVQGGKFFITPSSTSRFGHRVVGAPYQGAFVFLDTLRTNDLFFQLLEQGLAVPIDVERTRQHTANRGAYVLVLRNSRNVEISVGRLGRIHFEEGFYIYVGSGLSGLDARVRRHQSKRKKTFWQ